MARSLSRAMVASLAVGLFGCGNFTLAKQDCERYRDRLVEWGKAKGSVDQQKVDDFMGACPGAVVSRSAHGCLEKATDESSFFKCLE